MHDIEHKDAKAVANIQTDDNTGIVEALVSITGVVDNVKDIIEPGAYEKTLKTRKPKGVWSHDWNTPVSKTLDIKELMPGDPLLPKTQPNGDAWPKEAGALYVKMQFNLNTQRGREAYEDVKFHGEDTEFSIGYTVPKGKATKDDNTGIRRIKELNLFEYSPVLFGAASNSRLLTAVKGLFGSDDEFLDEVKNVMETKGGEEQDEEVDVESITESDEGLDDEDKTTIDEIVADSASEDAPESGEVAEVVEVGHKDDHEHDDEESELSAPEGVEEVKVSFDVDVKAYLEKLEATVALLAEKIDSLSKGAIFEVTIPESEEKTIENSDLVDSKSIRDEMDKLIYDSTFDPKLLDAIDNAVVVLEGAIKSANQDVIRQSATAAINGVQAALDSNPDEQTEAGLKALAQSISDAIGGEAQTEPAKEEEKKVALSVSEWKSLFEN